MIIMKMKGIANSKIIIEARVLHPEKLINALWISDIRVYKIKKKNTTTLRLEVEEEDFIKLCEIIEHKGGHVKVITSKGLKAVEERLKNNKTLVIAAIIFLGVLYFLSTNIWAIEIKGQKNIAPFQIRKELESFGITPGIDKDDINVKDIEKKLENINSEILWVRVRIEGSTLKVQIDEKINPPKFVRNDYRNVIAEKPGEIQNIYSYSGRCKVKEGDNVEAGDILIEGIDGIEGQEYIVKPNGVVMANTFYEKEMLIKIQGDEVIRSGESDKDIFIKILGKKFYLKKAIKNFEQYDRIEKSGKVVNEVIYYEKVNSEVNLSEEEAIKNASTELEKSLLKELTREAKIVDKLITTELNNKGELLVRIVFIVKQNIAQSI